MSWRQAINKPPPKPVGPKPKFSENDDDWETDPTYENTVTEKSQRYGSSSVPGSGRIDHVDMNTIHDRIKTADNKSKEMYQEKNPNRGYGGKYGTEQVMDKSAADFSYKSDIKKHSSQTDSKKGFGGEHGIDERAKDKSAVGYDYQAKVEKHSSQTDYSAGFGGNYGVQKEQPTKPQAPAPLPKPKIVPKVTEKPITTATNKADVGDLRARFENMKKEQESESSKKVAELRKTRSTTDNKPVPKAKENIEQEDKIVKIQETIDQPPPIEVTVAAEPELNISDANAHNDQSTDIPETTANEEEHKLATDQHIEHVDVTSLLRHRKSPSPPPESDSEVED